MCSGDDANAKVFLELLEEDEGEHCVGNQADPCGDKTLRQNLALDHYAYFFSHYICQFKCKLSVKYNFGGLPTTINADNYGSES